MTRSIPISISLLALSLVACDDHTEGVAAATVGESSGAVAPAPAPAAGEAIARQTLAIAADRSSVGFTGAKVTGSHDGRFDTFSGTVELDPASLERSSVRIEIQMSSLQIDPPRLRGHLLTGDFFDAETYPTATFASTRIAAGGEGGTHTVTGDLTMHGQTRSITFPATIEVSDGDVHARAEFSIDRRDFGIVYPGMPDDLIRDEVVIRFDVHAPRS